jgi:hypothetical protein
MDHPQTLSLSTHQAPLLLAGSAANDWLAHMILAVKTVAAGAEFIPLPYLRAVFGTVVVLLETVDVCSHQSTLILGSHSCRAENEEKPRRPTGFVRKHIRDSPHSSE